MTSRRWSWTLNNYTSEEVAALVSLDEQDPKPFRYLIFGEETGAEGTPHLQGYVEFSSTKRLSGVKRLLGNRIHAEVARGSGQQNKDYCTKEDGTHYEFGQLRRSNQGRRTDLEEVKRDIEDGKTEQEIATAHFGQWVRYRAAFQAYRTLINRPVVQVNYQLETFPVNWQNIVFDWSKTQILWGESGIGKTEFACAVLPGALMVSHMDDLKNFDKDYHSGIIFDDVDIKHFPRTSQIHLLDQTQDRSIHIRYACAFIPKGTKKIFTTNEEGGNCTELTDNAIRRRTQIHNLLKFD